MKRYRHNRSNTRLTSFNMGLIIPTACHITVPGTTVVGGVAAGLQLAPMVHQAMSQIRVDTFAIAAPIRTVWKDAENFFTGGADGDTRPTPPYFLAPDDTGWTVGSSMDHLGFPTGIKKLKSSAIPARVLAKWWNENCRDDQLQNEVAWSDSSGLDVTTYTGDYRLNWPKDMFTTARPNSTLGNDVVIPLAQNAPVVGNGNTLGLTDGTGTYGLSNFVAGTTGDALYVMDDRAGTPVGTTGGTIHASNPATTLGVTTDASNSGVIADLSQTTGILPDEFKFAMSRATWKNRRNLFGSAFRDWLAFLGIRYSDARLQNAITLAHGRQLVDVSAVLQTAPGSDSYVGQVAGRGTGFASCSYKRYFEEPMCIIHLICVRPAPLYVNMNPMEWDFEVREDLYTPEFAHVGGSYIKAGTLYPTGVESDDNAIWGYANRYDFMRTGFNDISGSMKTVNSSYHQGRIFGSAPRLNSDFLECNPSGRIFALTDADLGDQIEACAVRNKFIEKNMVTPNGNPLY